MKTLLVVCVTSGNVISNSSSIVTVAVEVMVVVIVIGLVVNITVTRVVKWDAVV